ncbi:hypothetical protein SFRURICE_019985 [Spodoptera frugiperda]|nr:hypothetical protein SFRURICE_019985 [Spodoptera frugiperda]
MPHRHIRLVDVFIRRRSNPKSHFRRIIVGNRASLSGVVLKKPLRGGDTRLCPALSGSTNVAKRLDVIVYPGNIRRVTGHARPECATSIRFQLITARTWCVGCQPPPTSHPSPIFVLQSLLQSSIQFRIPIHPSNVGFRCPFPGVRAGGAVRYGRFRIKLDWRGLFVPCNNSFDKLSPLTLKLATTM